MIDLKIVSGFILSGLLFLTLHLDCIAQEKITIPVDEYHPSQKADKKNAKWDVMELKADNLTQYELTSNEEGEKIIKAVSKNAASGLVYKVDIDPGEYSVIEWKWKVDGVLAKGDISEKDGDDYPARIYITFDFDRKDLSFGDKIKYGAIKTFTSYDIPLRAMNYIWANKAEKGTIANNPFTGWVKMVAVESGKEKAGMWMNESRNIFEDYKEAFGEEPPRITGVAIMTDSDNTKGSATGYYGDIIFRQEKETAGNVGSAQ